MSWRACKRRCLFGVALKRHESGARLGAYDGDAPVHKVHLAELADHDVRWLDVTVNYAPAVREGECITDLDDDVQHLEECVVVKRRWGFFEDLGEGLAPDELHREIQLAGVVDR